MGVAWLVMWGVREGGLLLSRSTTARNATRRRGFMPHQSALASGSTSHKAAHIFVEDGSEHRRFETFVVYLPLQRVELKECTIFCFLGYMRAYRGW